ncbi:hypothetical protein G6O69_28650 [Pseudenhygromyxa sp. WMMC2535]|uniref:hypothetical protein n=1 Tax=Pseudenhygromyxa sp. WMMC2535 TaxID=2712867 RepID=UPI00155817B4|nr:hypothetical protein [Pseudenhygromyxa sp. WMMC2535]NVB41837.1 hypothetical protein [Pseudenhygromyxa sp. WMMC2535]
MSALALHSQLSMPGSAIRDIPASTPKDAPSAKLRQLAHRWLPMLLRRVGVASRCVHLLLKPNVDDMELLIRLKVVRDAALLSAASAWAKHDRQNAELAESAAAIAGQLALGIELSSRNEQAAERSVARAADLLVSLLVIRPSGGSEIAPTPAAPLPQKRSWWSRLRRWLSWGSRHQ